jgi:hypothetical protein
VNGTRGDPPRHVRDIAHLYLSRMRRPASGGVRLVVAGMSADVVPAFHVANLALAAAARGLAASVEERSGLPANAGCFLGLDPRLWVARRNGLPPAVTAFARVTFALADGADGDGRPAHNGAGEEIEIVHVPPWDAGGAHERALSRARATTVLYLAESDTEPRPWREWDGDVVRRVAYVTRAGHNGAGGECAGAFTRWTRFLTDPLPVVVRDPASHLARQYADALSALLSESSRAPADRPPHIEGRHAFAAYKPR